MNKNTTTPPAIANLKYCPKTFETIIARMGNDMGLISQVKVEVWAEFEGKAVEILRTYMSPERRDKVEKNASRMIFTGSREDLRKLGVAV